MDIGSIPLIHIVGYYVIAVVVDGVISMLEVMAQAIIQKVSLMLHSFLIFSDVRELFIG